MDIYTLYLQTLYNGLVDQGKPMPVRLRALLNRDTPHLLLQHPTGAWRNDLLTSIEFGSEVWSLAIRPACIETNGRDWLAVGCADGSVYVHTPDTGAVVSVDGHPLSWKAHSEGVASLAWSKDGLLASISLSRDSAVWRPGAQERPVWLPNDVRFLYHGIAFSQDGRLASGCWHDTVAIWRPESEDKPIWVGQGYRQKVNALSWSATGLLATAGGPGVVVWNPDEQDQPIHILRGDRNELVSVAWSPSGLIAAADGWESVYVWDPEHSVDPLWAFALSGDGTDRIGWSEDNRLSVGCNSVGWSDDGRLAVGCYDGGVVVWRENEWDRIAWTGWSHRFLKALTWLGNGVLSCGGESRKVVTWRPKQVQRNEVAPQWRYSSKTQRAAWSASGILASGYADTEVTVWDSEFMQTPKWTGALSRSPWGHGEHHTSSIQWSADARLATTGSRGAVWVWLPGRENPVWIGDVERVSRSVAWSADGKQLAYACDNYFATIGVFRPEERMNSEPIPEWVGVYAVDEDGKIAPVLRPFPECLGVDMGEVNCVAWMPDGKIAGTTKGGAVGVWQPGPHCVDFREEGIPRISAIYDQESVSPVWRGLRPWRSNAFWVSLACSLDGRVSAGSEDGWVAVWQAGSDEAPLWRFDVSGMQRKTDVTQSPRRSDTWTGVRHLAWSPNARILAVGADNGLVVLLDGADGTLCACIATFGEVIAMRWSPDGRELWVADRNPSRQCGWSAYMLVLEGSG